MGLLRTLAAPLPGFFLELYMPGICLYFQAHQPYRLSALTRFDHSVGLDYFDTWSNQRIVQRVAANCYSPVAQCLEKLLSHFGDAFSVTYSLSGVVLEQLAKHCPSTVEHLAQVFHHDSVELLAETYYHSLASLRNTEEWLKQIALHGQLVERLFGKQPTSFRDTELLYNDTTASMIARLGYTSILTEGVPGLLGNKQRLYQPACDASNSIAVLFRDFEKSDDIAFRFSDFRAQGTPLTPKHFVASLKDQVPSDGCIVLGLDIETFGEHQPLDSGVLDFLEGIVSECIETGWQCYTPSTLAEKAQQNSNAWIFSCPTTISWADTERDTSAWDGNPLQQRALDALWELRQQVAHIDSPQVWETWRKLSSSDHFYYMSTKSGSDGQVHQTFNAYESPYDAFIVFMNVLNDFGKQLGGSVHSEAGLTS
jgi:alpha-amylase